MVVDVPNRELAKQDYSRQDVRRMLGVTEQRLRSWERQGLIPAASVFTFSDLITLKALQKLSEQHIPPRKIGRALDSLKRKLAHIERPLSQLKILSDGKTIAVQIAGQRMEALTGQFLFDFDAADLRNLKTFPPKVEPPATREREAETWFQRGLVLEETGAPVGEVIAAYERAVQLNSNAAGALVNLGTLYYRTRKYREAEVLYRRAIEADARYPLAQFNLGNLYDEQGDLERARTHYQEALKLNPSYADAHFNVALLSEKTGDTLRAVRHWKEYLKLDSASSWAKIARRQLDRLKQLTIVDSRS